MKPFDQAWTLLKAEEWKGKYPEPENQEQIDYNQMIMRNPGGFDRRWCAMPDCHAFVARNSDYCIEHKNVVKAIPILPRGAIRPKVRGQTSLRNWTKQPFRDWRRSIGGSRGKETQPVRSTRQTELGDSTPNSGLPGEIHHTQGPIEALHGKHLSPSSRRRIRIEGIRPIEDWGNMVDWGNKQIPFGAIGHVGEGRWDGEMNLINPDVPIHTSVTTDPSTAENYARGVIENRETWRDDIGHQSLDRTKGNRGYDDDGNRIWQEKGDREATIFGVRSNAMKRRQALDDARRDKSHITQGETGLPWGDARGNDSQFIEGGASPEELYQFDNRHRREFSGDSSRDRPLKLETVLDEFNAWQGRPDKSWDDVDLGGLTTSGRLQGYPTDRTGKATGVAVKNREFRGGHDVMNDTTYDLTRDNNDIEGTGKTLADRNAENRIGHSENLAQRNNRISREMGGHKAVGRTHKKGDQVDIANAQEQATQDIRGQWQEREDLRQAQVQRHQDRMNKVGEFAPPTPTGTQTTLGQFDPNMPSPALTPPQQPQQMTGIQPSLQPPAPAPWSPNARAEGFAKAFDNAWGVLKMHFPGTSNMARTARGEIEMNPLPSSRQTKLYNFPSTESSPSPYGKTRLYHGTSSDNIASIMTQGLGAENRKVYATGEPSIAGIHANRHDGTGAVFGIREAAGVGRPMTTTSGRPWGGAGSTRDPDGYRIFDGTIHPDALVYMGVPGPNPSKRWQTAGGAQSSLDSTDRTQEQ